VVLDDASEHEQPAVDDLAKGEEAQVPDFYRIRFSNFQLPHGFEIDLMIHGLAEDGAGFSWIENLGDPRAARVDHNGLE